MHPIACIRFACVSKVFHIGLKAEKYNGLGDKKKKNGEEEKDVSTKNAGLGFC